MGRWDELKAAANAFYLNKGYSDLLNDDAKYDALAKQFEEETGESVKFLVDWPDQLVVDNEPEEALEKDIVRDNNLKGAVIEMFTQNGLAHKNGGRPFQYANLKYDGGGIKLVYDKNGRLQRVQSTPDEKLGIIRTEQFWDIVPHQIPAELGIKCIRGEVLVDAGVYGKLARNKANGLINSTVNQDEIPREAFIRWYKLTYFDGNWTLQRQMKDTYSIPDINMERERRTDYDSDHVGRFKDEVFIHAEYLDENDMPWDAIWTENGTGHRFQVDGVVVYTDAVGIRGKKFYFTDSAVTTVLDVQWNQQPNGSYAAVLKLDPVTIDEKFVKQVSSGGVRNMMGLSDNSPGAMGIGAKVRVILANTTIPKIVEVLQESNDFNWPTCKCGYQMNENDCYGATLKCGNKDVCCDKVEKWLPEVAQWFVEETSWGEVDQIFSVLNAMRRSPQWFGYVFHIDRWDPYDQFKHNGDDHYMMSGSSSDDGNWLNDIVRSFSGPDKKSALEQMEKWCTKMYNFSELQWENLLINMASGLEVLHKLNEMQSIDKIKEYLNNYNNS